MDYKYNENALINGNKYVYLLNKNHIHLYNKIKSNE